jgi:polar amino acid transport system substrate-binding protein
MKQLRDWCAAAWLALALGLGAITSATAQPVPAQAVQPALVKLLPADIAASKVLTVAVALGSPPDDFHDEKGGIVGWEIDILRAATEAMGLRLELRPTTFDSLIPGLQARRFDAAVGQMGVTVVREKVVDMVGTLTAKELFAALADSSIKINGIEDLCGLTVATTRGSREMVFADEQNPKCVAAGKPKINALAFNDGNGAAESLMSHRSDLFWLGSTAVSYFVTQSKGRTKVVGSYTDTSYLGIAMPKGSDMAIPMQAAVQYLIDNGAYQAIVRKWGLEAGAIKQAPLNPTNAPQ